MTWTMNDHQRQLVRALDGLADQTVTLAVKRSDSDNCTCIDDCECPDVIVAHLASCPGRWNGRFYAHAIGYSTAIRAEDIEHVVLCATCGPGA